MKFRLRFLAFALGTGLAFAAPTAAQAQVSVGVNIGLPPWGPPVPQGTQYYYIPEIDGYYDIYNGVYLVFDGQQWVTQPYLDGYDPYYFHPVPVLSYAGQQPWLYISSYRRRYPQYVTVYRGGGYGGGGRYYGQEYGAGRVYGYDHGGYGNQGYGNRNYGRPGYGPGGYDNRGFARDGNGGRGSFTAPPRIEPNRGGDHDGRNNPGGFGGNQPGRGGFGGGSPAAGQPSPGRGSYGGQPGGGGQRGQGGDHGGGRGRR